MICIKINTAAHLPLSSTSPTPPVPPPPAASPPLLHSTTSWLTSCTAYPSWSPPSTLLCLLGKELKSPNIFLLNIHRKINLPLSLYNTSSFPTSHQSPEREQVGYQILMMLNSCKDVHTKPSNFMDSAFFLQAWASVL